MPKSHEATLGLPLTGMTRQKLRTEMSSFTSSYLVMRSNEMRSGGWGVLRKRRCMRREGVLDGHGGGVGA